VSRGAAGARRRRADRAEAAAAAGGFVRALAGALRRAGVLPRQLLAPAALDLASTILRLLTLGLWLPLIHGLLAGRVHFGRRLAFLTAWLPESLPPESLPRVYAAIAAAILVLTVLRCLADVLAVRRRAALTAAAEVRVGGLLLDRHLGFGQSYYDAVPPRSTLVHLERLPRKLGRVIPWTLRGAGAAAEMLLYAAAMLLLAREVAAAALGALALYYGVFRRLLDEAEARASEEDDVDEEAAGDAHDLVSNLLLAVLNRPRQATVAEYELRARRRGEASGRRQEVLEIIEGSREALNVAMVLALVLGVAWLSGGAGAGMVSRYVVFFFILRRCMGTFSTLQRLPRQWANLRDQFATLERVLESGSRSVVPSGPIRFAGIGRGVTATALSFSYPDGPRVLDDVALELGVGRLNAVVGPNGSGKSTLMKLLLRLYDCPPGTLAVDGTDIRELDIESLRARTAFVGPEPMLLRGTIRDNLLYGADPALVSGRHLADAVERSALAGALAELPGGLDTEVGSAGGGLSRGQQQLVALARALLRRADLLLLDEAVSSLDGDTERAVLATLSDLAAHRLVVLVTHRVEALPGAAFVGVLERGRVVQTGTRRVLTDTDGPFRRLLGDREAGGGRAAAVAMGER